MIEGRTFDPATMEPNTVTEVEQVRAYRADTINGALLAFQADMPVLTKDKDGQAGNIKTKYADLVQVNKEVLAKLNALGVVYICQPNLLDDGKFVLEYVLLHVASGTFRGGRYPLKLSENAQHMGSAISYSRRYVLLAITGVAADDDDGAAQSRTAQRAERAARPRSQQGASGGTGEAGNVAQRQTSDSVPPLPDETLPLLPVQRAKIVTMFDAFHITSRTERLDITAGIVKRDLGSVNEMTRKEATDTMAVLDAAAASGNAAKYLHAFLPDDTNREGTTP